MANNSIWNDTEQSLVILMQQGNQQVFGRLFDKYAPMLMGLIIKLVGDKKTAEDVLQQVFHKLWDNKTLFDFFKGTPVLQNEQNSKGYSEGSNLHGEN